MESATLIGRSAPGLEPTYCGPHVCTHRRAVPLNRSMAQATNSCFCVSHAVANVPRGQARCTLTGSHLGGGLVRSP
eukprot:4702086-Prymnesium_polylepis.1